MILIHRSVDIDIPVYLGRSSDGKVFILTLAEASELLEDINRVRRIEIYKVSWI